MKWEPNIIVALIQVVPPSCHPSREPNVEMIESYRRTAFVVGVASSTAVKLRCIQRRNGRCIVHLNPPSLLVIIVSKR